MFKWQNKPQVEHKPLSETTHHGTIEVEATGKTSTFVEFFYYGDEIEDKHLNSDDSPHYEGSPWAHSDFYLQYKDERISYKDQTLTGLPYAIPRHAEVINGKAYVILGEYNYPYSERFEERRGKWLNLLDPPQDIRDTVNTFFVGEMEIEERTETLNPLKKPDGSLFWTYNDLQSSQLVNKIVQGAPGKQTSIDTGSNVSTNEQEESAEIITSPQKFNKKSADKITNFNPSTDTLEIDTDSFGIDSSPPLLLAKTKK